MSSRPGGGAGGSGGRASTQGGATIAAATGEAQVQERVKQLATAILREDDGFFYLVSTLDRIKNAQIPHGGGGGGGPTRHLPDIGTLDEIRKHLVHTSRWCTQMEAEANGTLETVRYFQPLDADNSDLGGGGLGGREGSYSSTTGGSQEQHQAQQQQVSDGGEIGVKGKGKRRKVMTNGGGSQKASTTKPIKLPHLERAPEINDQAAAKISNTQPWCYTRVITYNDITDNVEVVDVDDVRKRTYLVPRDHLVLLPKGSKETLSKFYLKNSKVFALYPETTSFYPATVVENNVRRDGEVYATLWFDEDEDDAGQVPAREVPLKLITMIPLTFGGEGLGGAV